jgi:hypothetical protein
MTSAPGCPWEGYRSTVPIIVSSQHPVPGFRGALAFWQDREKHVQIERSRLVKPIRPSRKSAPDLLGAGNAKAEPQPSSINASSMTTGRSAIPRLAQLKRSESSKDHMGRDVRAIPRKKPGAPARPESVCSTACASSPRWPLDLGFPSAGQLTDRSASSACASSSPRWPPDTDRSGTACGSSPRWPLDTDRSGTACASSPRWPLDTDRSCRTDNSHSPREDDRASHTTEKLQQGRSSKSPRCRSSSEETETRARPSPRPALQRTPVAISSSLKALLASPSPNSSSSYSPPESARGAAPAGRSPRSQNRWAWDFPGSGSQNPAPALKNDSGVGLRLEVESRWQADLCVEKKAWPVNPEVHPCGSGSASDLAIGKQKQESDCLKQTSRLRWKPVPWTSVKEEAASRCGKGVPRFGKTVHSPPLGSRSGGYSQLPALPLPPSEAGSEGSEERLCGDSVWLPSTAGGLPEQQAAEAKLAATSTSAHGAEELCSESVMIM